MYINICFNSYKLNSSRKQQINYIIWEAQLAIRGATTSLVFGITPRNFREPSVPEIELGPLHTMFQCTQYIALSLTSSIYFLMTVVKPMPQGQISIYNGFLGENMNPNPVAMYRFTLQKQHKNTYFALLFNQK